MTIEERIRYACVHADMDWFLATVIEIARSGKLEHEEARNLIESILMED